MSLKERSDAPKLHILEVSLGYPALGKLLSGLELLEDCFYFEGGTLTCGWAFLRSNTDMVL